MIEIAYILWCLIASYLGCRFVVWALKKYIPEPSASYQSLRFLFWWLVVFMGSVGLYMFVVSGPTQIIIVRSEFFADFEQSVFILGGFVLMLPFIVGFFKAWDLQTERRYSR